MALSVEPLNPLLADSMLLIPPDPGRGAVPHIFGIEECTECDIGIQCTDNGIATGPQQQWRLRCPETYTLEIGKRAYPSVYSIIVVFQWRTMQNTYPIYTA